MNIRKLLFDHGTERHRREQLLTQDNGYADNVWLFFDDRWFQNMLKYIAIDIDLRILYGLQHF